jgi:hypothetical protein
MSRASTTVSASLTWLSWTMMRISRPAWMAYAFSTPRKESAISSSFSMRLT